MELQPSGGVTVTLVVPDQTPVQKSEAARLRNAIAQYGFSEYAGAGVWEGIRESHVRIEIFLGEDGASAALRSVLRAFAAYGVNAKDMVLYWRVDGKVYFAAPAELRDSLPVLATRRKIGDSCPRCGVILSGKTLIESEPCADCARGEVSCHACGW